MATRTWAILVLLLLPPLLFSPSCSIIFHLPATPASEQTENTPLCLAQLVPEEVHVKGVYSISPGTQQSINMDVFDVPGSGHSNIYYSRQDVSGEGTFTFTTHRSAPVQICVSNIVDGDIQGGGNAMRAVTLSLRTGAEAYDEGDDVFKGKSETLKPVEKTLRKLEYVMDEVSADVEYLIEREKGLRDTNEMANDRVAYFAAWTLFVLVAVGVWQLVYLRRYFKAKKLI